MYIIKSLALGSRLIVVESFDLASAKEKQILMLTNPVNEIAHIS